MNGPVISPDQIVYWKWSVVSLNATVVFTWGVMAFLAIGSWLVTRRLTVGPPVPRWQNALEVIVDGIRGQMRDVAGRDSDRHLPLIGTLFLFILTCNVLTIVPGYAPPTGSLSTTAALAGIVFIAVPLYGILDRGVANYLKRYIRPTPLMLPFNVVGELSRTLAMAVRLFGNIMSGTKVVGILVAIAPLFFPVLMRLLGLLTGTVQAYIFAVLAMVYISSASRPRDEAKDPASEGADDGEGSSSKKKDT